MSSDSIKVPARTRELVRLGASIERCTQEEFVERATKEFVENHRKEIESGFVYARKVLGA